MNRFRFSVHGSGVHPLFHLVGRVLPGLLSENAMTSSELFEAISKLSAVELEQRVKQLTCELEATKHLLKLAKARNKGRKRKTAETALVAGGNGP